MLAFPSRLRHTAAPGVNWRVLGQDSCRPTDGRVSVTRYSVLGRPEGRNSLLALV